MWQNLSKLLKTYKLDHLSLNSRQIKEEASRWLSADIEVQTLVVFQSYPPLKRRQKDNAKYFKFIPEKYVSILEEKVRGKLMDQNNALCREWEAKLAQQGIKSGHKNYGPKLDAEVAKTTKLFRQELYEEVLREQAFYRCLDLDPQLEAKSEAFIRKVVNKYLADPKKKQAVHRHITRGRTGYKRERIYDHQVAAEFIPLIDFRGEVYNWAQVYLVINHTEQTIYYVMGRSRGSYGRDMHSHFAQVFGELKNQGKTCPSHVLFFNHLGEFFHFSEPSLIIIDRDLRTAFTKDEEVNEYLKTTRLVHSAKDLSFDFFAATGLVLPWEER
jgi:hypothetical protein